MVKGYIRDPMQCVLGINWETKLG